MYIIDLFKHVSKREKGKGVAALIGYLFTNLFLTFAIAEVAIVLIYLITMPFVKGSSMPSIPLMFVIIWGTYVIAFLVSISPVGEWALKVINHYKEYNNPESDFMVLFNEVYENARKLNPSIPEGIKLLINPKDKSTRVFAVGRKSICMAAGFMECTEDQIRGALAHEFGHLANKDTDLVLMISVGSLPLSAFIWVTSLIVTGCVKLGTAMTGLFKAVTSPIGGLIGLVLIPFELLAVALGWAMVLVGKALLFIFDKLEDLILFIGVKLVRFIAIGDELEADEFACNAGYENELFDYLTVPDSYVEDYPSDLFEYLTDLQVPGDTRIDILNENKAS